MKLETLRFWNFNLEIFTQWTWDFELLRFEISKLKAWALKLEIMKVEAWNLENLWFEILNMKSKVWNFLQLEILGILNLKIGHLECENFKLGNENFELKIWDLGLLLKICSWRFFLWRFIQEIFPFMKMCSWRFVLSRFVHADLSFWRFV